MPLLTSLNIVKSMVTPVFDIIVQIKLEERNVCSPIAQALNSK